VLRPPISNPLLHLLWILCVTAPTLATAAPVSTSRAQQATNVPALSDLLKDAKGNTIATIDGWQKQRARLRKEWLDLLGPLPETKVPLNATVIESADTPQFKRSLVRCQIESGVYADGYLLTPKNRQGPLPGVVVFHPSTPFHAKGVAGLEPSYPQDKWQGVHLVMRGYVAWCPRNYIYGPGADWIGNARKLLAAHTNWTGMTRMVWDAIRAADYLQSLSDVDPERIGCLGHSLGAKEVLYAMAFDERYKAGVSSEGGVGLKFSNWDAPWYLGEKISEPGFALENHQVLALVAPRPFLLLAGDSADGERSSRFIEAVRPVYRLLGAPHRLSSWNHHSGHAYPPEARARAEEFLDEFLRR
jgi:dienelactone hydrolase